MEIVGAGPQATTKEAMHQEELIAAVARLEELLAELRAVPTPDILVELELAAEAPMMRPLVAQRFARRMDMVRKMARAVISLQSTLGQIERTHR